MTTIFPKQRICALIIACGIAASIGAPLRARAADTIVNVVAIPGDPSANVFYAVDMGFFKNAGLDVHLTMMTNAPAGVAAVASGAADIAVSNVGTVAAARERGLPLRFIAPAAIVTPETNTDLLFVPVDSSVRSGADVNGKTIAIPGLKSLQQVHVSAWIDKNGGDSKTVKFVEIPFPAISQALTSHRVDAGLLTEPFSSANKSSLRSLGSVLQSIGPRYMLLGWAATDAWTNRNPDVAAKFASAIRQASAWANANHKESAPILIKYTHADMNAVDAMARTTYGTELSPLMIAPAVDAALKYGVIDRPIAASDLIWSPAQTGKQ
jgi:NitT/TauT family transport system substrate-binding protein